MGRAKKAANDEKDEAHDFTMQLIKDLNRERGDRVAYNLSIDTSPTHVKRWIPSGVTSLDLIVANRLNGGLPEGRIVEIFGPPSIGKSHIAAQICKSAQKMGGLAVYIDSEIATSVENLENLGVNVSKGFVYVPEHCTEHALSIVESTINKSRAYAKDLPVVIVWDSVAASSPKAELEGDYDKDTIGLKARAISKGMRKINSVIANQNVLFVILNQVRTAIGVMYGDPDTTPGGKAIPFHSSVRIKLGSGSAIKNKAGDVVGINVTAKTIKNKVAAPFRTVRFQIHFGIGIKEHEELFDDLRKVGPVEANGKIYHVGGDGAWKHFTVWDTSVPENQAATNDARTIMQGKDKTKAVKSDIVRPIYQKKFYKVDFDEIVNDPEVRPMLDHVLEKCYVRNYNNEDELPDIDEDSYEEMKQIASDITEMFGDDPEF